MSADENWICPAMPFAHSWDESALCCRSCGAERSAAEAIESLLSGIRGWSRERAERLVEAHAEQVKNTRT